ncbi:unnamed protein product [Diatraea saccharalis]|uniref:Uncharacterized protein n=1 Tax=Diatraea saccharalis TaxID=40085 RepID=A0A9N9R9B3_9NEOP|nr:unnamed protein product [Diatraea saccharalis]
MQPRVLFKHFHVILLEQASANAVPEPKHSIVARDARRCGTAECSEHCRKLGHVRGVCIGTLCQCRSLKKRSIPKTELQLTKHEHKIVTRATCDPADCNAFCQKLGHKRGVCVGYCQCRAI